MVTWAVCTRHPQHEGRPWHIKKTLMKLLLLHGSYVVAVLCSMQLAGVVLSSALFSLRMRTAFPDTRQLVELVSTLKNDGEST